MARSVIITIFCLATIVTLMDASSNDPANKQTIEENGIKTRMKFIMNHPLNKDRPASLLLGPPLTNEEVFFTLLPMLENIDGANIEQLVQLYATTDGLKTSETDGLALNELWLIPGYYLMSLEEAVEILMTMKRISDVWNPTSLPIFSSRAGDFIVFDLSSGRLLEIFTKESMRWDVAASIEDFLQHLVHDLKSGKILVREDGLMDEIMTDDTAKSEKQHGEKTHKYLNLPKDQLFDIIYIPRAGVKNRPVLRMNFEEDVQQPNLVFNCGNMPNVCQNIRNAININGKTRNLQRITNRTHIRRNRRLACGRTRCPRGQTCDEYPFASTAQGGRGATVMCVPAAENNSQGGQLNGFYRANRLGNGAWYHMANP